MIAENVIVYVSTTSKYDFFRKIQQHLQIFSTATRFIKVSPYSYCLLCCKVMGQDISKVVNPPPLTLTHCFLDGNIDLGRYCVYKRRRAQHEKASLMHRKNNKKRRRCFNDTLLSKKKRKDNSRSAKRYKLLVRDSDRSLRTIRPEDTLWYLLYVN